MRITTYEKGGNSLNPFIKLSIFLMIILCLFVMPGSAFIDDFDDNDITDWNFPIGVWTNQSGGQPAGSVGYMQSTSATATATKTITEIIPTYMSVWIYSPDNPDVSAYFSDSQYFYIDYTFTGTTATFIQSTGSTSICSLALDQWYKFEVERAGSNVHLKVYNSALTVVGDVVVTAAPKDTITEAKIIKTNGYNKAVKIDEYKILQVAPETESSIIFSHDLYYLNDQMVIDYIIAESWWTTFIYKFRIQILNNGVEIDTVGIGQTGNYYLDAVNLGGYTAKVQYSGYIFTNWISIDSDNANVIPQADSYINVPKTAEQKTNFTVNYLYGVTPPTAAIFIKKLNEELEEYILYDIIYLDGGVINTDYSQNISIWSEGFYKLVLYNANIQEQDLKTDVIQIIKVIIPPQTIINISRIRSQQDTYSKSDMVLGDYAVDFTNYTDYIINLELYNYEYDSVVYSETVADQSGVVLISLYSTDLTIFTGLNNIRLSSYSNTGVFIDDIVYDNITINLVDPDGYGLTLSKYEVYTDETFVIKCIVPYASSLKIINRLTLEEIDNIEINSSTYINYKISQIGDYEIRLIGASEYIRGNQYIKVVEGTIVDDPLIDEDEVISDTTMADNTNNLLNSPYLIGLFIMCVFLAVGSSSGIGGMIVTGSMGLGIVCWMGIFPWILLVIEVLVVAALMAKGMINLAGD